MPEDLLPIKTAKKAILTLRRSPMEHPHHQYPQETEALQKIAQSCGLMEKIKWGKPCYTLGSKNVVLIQRFNEYIALMFFKGALLKDSGKLLSRIGEHMQAPRQLRFTNVAEVERLGPTIKAYIEEAIALEEAGAMVLPLRAKEYEMPLELQARLDADPVLRTAFTALTPGRQKVYFFHISAAKLPATRASRVVKSIPKILAGKGLND